MSKLSNSAKAIDKTAAKLEREVAAFVAAARVEHVVASDAAGSRVVNAYTGMLDKAPSYARQTIDRAINRGVAEAKGEAFNGPVSLADKFPA